MKTKVFLLSIGLAAFFMIFLGSCQKDEADNELASVSKDETKVDNYFDDASSQVDMYEDGNSKSLIDKADCVVGVTVTFPQGGSFPRHIVIDYGTEGCTGLHGHVRKGKIIVDQTNRLSVTGATRTITFDGFSIDDYKIEGTRMVTANGLNTGGNYERTITLVNGKITTPDGKIITRNATHTHEWTAGFLTPFNITDDVWRITGGANGTNRLGKNYTTVITEALIWDLSCQYRLTKGIKTITTENHVIVIDYGDGSCDNSFNISIDGTKQ